jgi:MarR family transcriptional regulator, negative regulator of the multidrug operon emrRAB
MELADMTKLRTANLLGALAVAVSDRVDNQLKSHPNQTDSSAAALHLLGLFEGCSNSQLSSALKLSHPATVRLIDKLEADGLAASKPGTDRRSVALFLTAAGRKRVRAILQERCVVLEAIVNALSPQQRTQLDGIAETLLRSFTTTPIEGAHICRLCDEIACPPKRCPVHSEAVRQSATE